MKKLLLSITTLVILFAVTSSSYAQQRGYYNAPYTRYEAEAGSGTGTSVTSYSQDNIAFEASSRTCVYLSNGQSREWTAKADFRGIVVRASGADSLTATSGKNVSAKLYIDGAEVATLTFDSSYGWKRLQNLSGENHCGTFNYGGITNNSPRMRYDEQRYLHSASVASGKKIKIVSQGDLYLDFIEIEDVPDAIPCPSGYATWNGSNLQNFLNANTKVYIPAGSYNISGCIDMGSCNSLVGAGMWYTKLNWTSDGCSNSGFVSYNKDNELKDLFMNNSASKSRANNHKGLNGVWKNIDKVWIEHFECGAWFGNYSQDNYGDLNADGMTIKNSRFRSNYADGINLCKGSRNCVVSYCNFRNNGDDDMAIWPAGDQSRGTCYNNTYEYCTAEHCWLASSCALYGGYGNKWQNIIVRDNWEVGIRTNGKFGGYCFGDGALNEFSNIDVIGCGTWKDAYNEVVSAVDITTAPGCNNVKNIKFTCINIKDSNSDAIFLRNQNGWRITNVSMSGITINGTSKRGYTNNDNWGDAGGIRFVGNEEYSTFCDNVTFCGTFANVDGEEVINWGKPSGWTAKTTGCTTCASEIPVTGVSLNKTTMALCQGASETLTATIKPTNATNQKVSWVSSASGVATVDDNGKVTAVSDGSTVITVTTEDGGYTAKCTVTVTATPAVNTITTQTICSGTATTAVTLSSTPANATYNWTGTPTNVTGATASGSTSTIPAQTLTAGGTAAGTVIYNIIPTLNGCTGTAGTFTVNVNPLPTVNNIQPQTICSGGSTSLATLSSTPTNATYTWESTSTNVTGATNNGTGNIPAQTLTSTSTGTVTYTIIPTLNTCIGASKIFTVTVTGMPVVATPVPNETTLCAGSKINVSTPAVELNGSSQTNAVWKLGSTIITPTTYTLTAADDGKLLTYEVTNGCGTTVSTGVTITVNDVPAQPSIIAGNNNPTKGTTGLTYSVTNTPGVTYTWSFPTGWTTAGSTTNSVTVDATATAVSGTITVTPSNSCGNGTPQTLVVTVNEPSIPAAGVSVNPTTLTFYVGGASQAITATVSPNDATNQNVTWESDDTDIATVDANGNVSPVAVGTTTITVKTVDGGHTATCSVTVNPVLVTDVELNKNTTTITLGSDETLIATITPVNATDKTVTWESSDDAIATVDANGKVTAVAEGTVTITVKTNDGGYTDICTVTVNTTIIYVTDVELNKNTTTITVGNDETLTATVNPSNATDKTVTWESSDDAIATVDANGKVTAVAEGTITITVKTNDGGHTDICTVTVSAAVINVTDVELNKNTTTLTVGDNETLTATVNPIDANDKTVTWESSDDTVATVDANGKVTAVAEGTATITVKTNDGGHTDICTVTVNAAIINVTDVELNKNTTTLTIGANETLTATVNPTNATDKTVTWESSDDAIATVDANGKVTAVAEGTAVITVKTNDGGHTDICTVTVNTAVINVTDVELNKNTTTLTIGANETLTATVNPTNATDKTVTWESSDDAIATVDANGKVTAVAEGTAVITVKTNDGGHTDICTVTVQTGTINVIGITVNPTSNSIVKNETFTITATVTPANATNKDVTFSVVSGNFFADVDPATGLVTGLNCCGQATIRATSDEDGSIFAECVVTVGAGTINVTSVTLNKNTATLTAGTSETLLATVNPTSATDKTVTWSSSNDAIATVDANGQVTAVAPGTAIITVTTNDGGHTAVCNVTVNAAVTPVISVSLNKNTTSITQGQSETLLATVNPTNATDKTVAWTSSNPAVATVDSNGKVTAQATGTTIITVKTNDGNKTATCTVTVPSNIINVTGIVISPTTKTISVGSSFTLYATVTPTNATNQAVTYSVVSGDSFVSVNANTGLITGKAEGTAKVRVTTADGGKTAECTVIVTKSTVSVNGISINPGSATIKVGGEVTVVATVFPSNATNKAITYSVISGSSYISFNSKTGVVKGLAEGTAIIRATSASGNYSVDCVVKVERIAVGGVSIPDVYLSVGSTTTIVPVFTPINPTNKNVTYTIISGEDYIDIDPATGYVTAWGAGTAVVQVTTADGNKVATFSIIIYDPTVGISDIDGEGGKTIISYNNTIQVDGLTEGEIISVYNLSGIRTHIQEAAQATEYITVRIPGMYTVVIEGTNISGKVLITQ